MKLLGQYIELTQYHKILYRYMHTKINLYLTTYNFFRTMFAKEYVVAFCWYTQNVSSPCIDKLSQDPQYIFPS